ncbi:hypothetical protein BD410DRAFT_797027 [Rickenella mellea]|uniref:CFEM domain-containing protein n=1 Tax=Rickenella mellea TaxID=50990 RepID=A0A4Y7PIK3_9AGAM|nr:hypothetical protein BD410DRAFT_797027 [Rickenella mellea]
MPFTTKPLFVLAAVASAVLAQDTTASSDTALHNCWHRPSADLQCICTSAAFQSAALQCLQSSCSAAAIASATQLQAEECAGISGSDTGSAIGAPATGTGSTPAATGPATTPTAPVTTPKPTTTPANTSSKPSTTGSGTMSGTPGSTSKSAANTKFAFGMSGVVGAGVVALVGAVAGALVVL